MTTYFAPPTHNNTREQARILGQRLTGFQQPNVYNAAAALNLFASCFLVDTNEDAEAIENAYLKAAAGCELTGDQYHLFQWAYEHVTAARSLPRNTEG